MGYMSEKHMELTEEALAALESLSRAQTILWYMNLMSDIDLQVPKLSDMENGVTVELRNCLCRVRKFIACDLLKEALDVDPNDFKDKE